MVTRPIRNRVSSAHALAGTALFVALGGGAYAAATAPKNSVGSAAIRNGQVRPVDLAARAVRSKHLKNGQVKSADVANGAIGGADLADGAVTTPELGDGAVTGAKLAGGAVTDTALADGAVSSSKLGDGQVTGAKIADGQIGAAHLAPAEGLRFVGAPGQPAFGTGGQADCLWSNPVLATTPPNPFQEAAFYKSADGIVRLTGMVQARNGTGGDAQCGGSEPGVEDQTVFVLPPGYRPAKLIQFTVVGEPAVFINGEQTIIAGSNTILPGVVVASSGSREMLMALDGVQFRAASPAPASRRSAPVRLAPRTLELLLPGLAR